MHSDAGRTLGYSAELVDSFVFECMPLGVLGLREVDPFVRHPYLLGTECMEIEMEVIR